MKKLPDPNLYALPQAPVNKLKYCDVHWDGATRTITVDKGEPVTLHELYTWLKNVS